MRAPLGFALVLGFALAHCGGGSTAPAPAPLPIDAGSCPSGSIRFRLRSTSDRRYCIGAPGTCTAEWLSVRRYYGGEVLPLDRACLPECTSCTPMGCPAFCAAPSPLPPSGQERTWDGVYYPTSTCGAGTICANEACVPAGHYIARMCAYHDRSPADAGAVCDPSPTASCVEVELDWPPETGTAEITGTLSD